jgi:hypothetical protein
MTDCRRRTDPKEIESLVGSLRLLKKVNNGPVQRGPGKPQNARRAETSYVAICTVADVDLAERAG